MFYASRRDEESAFSKFSKYFPDIKQTAKMIDLKKTFLKTPVENPINDFYSYEKSCPNIL